MISDALSLSFHLTTHLIIYLPLYSWIYSTPSYHKICRSNPVDLCERLVPQQTWGQSGLRQGVNLLVIPLANLRHCGPCPGSNTRMPQSSLTITKNTTNHAQSDDCCITNVHLSTMEMIGPGMSKLGHPRILGGDLCLKEGYSSNSKSPSCATTIPPKAPLGRLETCKWVVSKIIGDILIASRIELS